MPSPLEARLEQIVQDGNFRKVWTKTKDLIANNKDLDKESKATLAKLYKKFDANLTEELAKFEKAPTTNNAMKHAQRAITIIKDYETKFEAARKDLGTDAKLGIGGTLSALRKHLEKSVNSIESDDSGVTKKVKKLANDASLHKVWSKLKESFASNKDLDKEDKKALAKLYESFDGGLSAVIKKFEKAKSDEEAIKYAKEGVAIMKDYQVKVSAMVQTLPSDTVMTLGGLLKKMQKYLEDWIEALASEE